MLLLYYSAFFLMKLVNTFSCQRYARISKGNRDTLVYSLITGIIAMVFFYVTSGFNLHFNLRTCVYGLVYASVVFITYFLTLAVYRYMGIAESSFITSGLSLGITVLTSLLFLRETLSIRTLAQLLLNVLTLLVIYLQNHTLKHEATAKTVTTIGIMICIGSAVVISASSVITKAFCRYSRHKR